MDTPVSAWPLNVTEHFSVHRMFKHVIHSGSVYGSSSISASRPQRPNPSVSLPDLFDSSSLKSMPIVVHLCPAECLKPYGTTSKIEKHRSVLLWWPYRIFALQLSPCPESVCLAREDSSKVLKHLCFNGLGSVQQRNATFTEIPGNIGSEYGW
jgi:hypothetical protein